jgi:hypothetical protein
MAGFVTVGRKEILCSTGRAPADGLALSLTGLSSSCFFSLSNERYKMMYFHRVLWHPDSDALVCGMPVSLPRSRAGKFHGRTAPPRSLHGGNLGTQDQHQA